MLTSAGLLDGSYLLGDIGDLGRVACPGGLVLCVVVHLESDQVDVDVASCEQRHCENQHSQDKHGIEVQVKHVDKLGYNFQLIQFLFLCG